MQHAGQHRRVRLFWTSLNCRNRKSTRWSVSSAGQACGGELLGGRCTAQGFGRPHACFDWQQREKYYSEMSVQQSTGLRSRNVVQESVRLRACLAKGAIADLPVGAVRALADLDVLRLQRPVRERHLCLQARSHMAATVICEGILALSIITGTTDIKSRQGTNVHAPHTPKFKHRTQVQQRVVTLIAE